MYIYYIYGICNINYIVFDNIMYADTFTFPCKKKSVILYRINPSGVKHVAARNLPIHS